MIKTLLNSVSRSANVNQSQHLILRFPQAMCLRLYLPCIQHKTAHGLNLVLFLRCYDANFKTLQGIRKQTFLGLLLVFSHLTLKSTSLPILETKTSLSKSVSLVLSYLS